jgi:hypothetical protein
MTCGMLLASILQGVRGWGLEGKDGSVAPCQFKGGDGAYQPPT